MGTIISLYDFTGEALRPWAEAGHTCAAYDIQHDPDTVLTENFEGGGSINYHHMDLHDPFNLCVLAKVYRGQDVVFGMAFPVCTDMAVSGAAWFKAKAAVNPDFHTEAMEHARSCSILFNILGVPYFVENPVSVLASLWRKPDYYFHPYEYGGYIPDSAGEHPRWPEYIAPFDAYKKKTCLWTGNGFVMPTKVSIDPEAYHGNGYSTAMMKLGGKSQRTKDIRSATPRGFAIAVCESNSNQGENQ